MSSAISDVAFSCKVSEDGCSSIDWLTGATEQITGYSVEEMVALRCWGALVIEEDRPAFYRNVTQLLPGEASSCELRIRQRMGESVGWLLRPSVTSSPGPPAQLFGGLVELKSRSASRLNCATRQSGNGRSIR